LFSVVSCSTEETSTNSLNLPTNGSFTARGTNPYEDLYEDLYADKYDIGSKYTITDDVESFDVTEIKYLSGSGSFVKGYLVVSTTSVSYFDYDSASDILDEYAFSSDGTYTKSSHDLTQDPDYVSGNIELGTTQPTGRGRFWGWTKPEDLNWSECLPGGTQVAVATHYVLWRENGTKLLSRACNY
jgi:hypothetical protein